MKIISKLIDFFKMDSTREMEAIQKQVEVPRYCTDMSWTQDSEQSIVANGTYDLKNFSKHESDTVKHVYNYVEKNYPKEYQAIGLANESYQIIYKPRYVLHEIIILKYQASSNPVDKFAVALAYATKGAYFRDKSLYYFESCIDDISPEFMSDFVSYMPLHTYSIISELYEQEHNYKQAIYYTNLQKKYGDPDNPFFENRIHMLNEKQNIQRTKRKLKISKKRAEFENDVTNAAKMFLETGELPIQKQANDQASSKSSSMTKYEVERYAVMCNAHLEHQEEMEQYKE